VQRKGFPRGALGPSRLYDNAVIVISAGVMGDAAAALIKLPIGSTLLVFVG